MSNPSRRRRNYFKKARCLVTGASSGLGRAIAERLAHAGASVVLTGRSMPRLDDVVRGLLSEGIHPDSICPLTADLTDPTDRIDLLKAVGERFDGALDLVVNCAGIGAYGRFESHSESALRALFEINVFALAEMCRLTQPMLRLGKRPSLVNIGSIVARRALPGRSEYSASKHAVAALTDSLRCEWLIDGIHVLLVNPGFTATPFEQNVVVDTAVYRTADRRTMSADAVAVAVLHAIRRRKNEVTLTAGGRMLLLTHRFFPGFVDWGLARWACRLYANTDALRAVERLPRIGESTMDPQTISNWETRDEVREESVPGGRC